MVQSLFQLCRFRDIIWRGPPDRAVLLRFLFYHNSTVRRPLPGYAEVITSLLEMCLENRTPQLLIAHCLALSVGVFRSS